MFTESDELTPSEIAQLVKRAATYDAADLLAGLGALQLLPENADRLFRLEAIASLMAQSLESTPIERPRMGPKRWRDLLNKPPVSTSSLTRLEDPHESLFVEQVTFFGGSMLVLPGLAEEITFIVRHLLRAVFLSPDPFPDGAFVQDVSRLSGLVLGLSDRILRRAGLRRGASAVHLNATDVVIPRGARFDELKRAVMFEPDDVAVVLRDSSASQEDLESLTLCMAGEKSISGDLLRIPLLRTPLVRFGSRHVVAAPGALLGALRHLIVSMATERGLVGGLAARYRSAVAHTIRESLDHLDARPLRLRAPSAGDAPLISAWFGFDRNKLLHVTAVTDSLTAYDLSDPYTRRPVERLAEQLQAHMMEAAEQVGDFQPVPEEVLFLVIFVGIGRQLRLESGTEIGPLGGDVLFMTGADLEVISLLERGNPLALRQYFQAKRRFYARVVVGNFSELDEFAFYRSNNYSYYASDGPLPTAAFFQNGLAEPLRQEVWRRYDFHGVTNADGCSVVEVVLLHDDIAIPLYTRHNTPAAINILIEGLPIDVWVLAPDPIPDPRYLPRYLELAELVAYWVWQFTADLEEPLQAVVSDVERIRIRLSLRPDPGWLGEANKDAATDGRVATEEAVDEVQCRILARDEIEVELDARILTSLDRPDNAGERGLMREVLRILAEWLAWYEVVVLGESNAWADSVIDRHAPLGEKKKLVVLSGDRAARLRTDGLPPRRFVQAAEEARILDEVGEFLATDLGLPEGPIIDSERVAVLNAIVGYLFQQLAADVAGLNPGEMLPWLVAYNERLVAEYRLTLLNLPTRLACFGATHDVARKLREDLPNGTKASTASRFLIEFATATPPNGTRAMSLAAYDRLLALASEIISFGWSSDLIYFGLADIKLARLPSGRLGQSRALFARGREEFLDTFAAGTLSRSRAHFARNWRPRPTDRDKPLLADEIDRAAQLELGLTVTQLLEFLVEGINAGERRRGPAKLAPRDELLSELATALGWDQSKAERAFDLLSLRSRSPFLQPPPPFRSADVYPWRFNRALSYLRRPFLVRQHDSVNDVVWGVRNLYEAFDYLSELILGGRLKTRTPHLRKILGRLQEGEAAGFNDEVADACEQLPNVIVHRRVRKLGALRVIRPNGEALGDIDVLVADRTRNLLWSIETKDLAVARTPAELSNELVSTFQPGGSKPSHAEKHAERTQWLERYLPDVLRALGIDAGQASTWRVRPLIVVSHELMSPFIAQTPIQTVPFRDLTSVLSAAGRAARPVVRRTSGRR